MSPLMMRFSPIPGTTVGATPLGNHLAPSQVHVTPAAVNCWPAVGLAGKSIMRRCSRNVVLVVRSSVCHAQSIRAAVACKLNAKTDAVAVNGKLKLYSL